MCRGPTPVSGIKQGMFWNFQQRQVVCFLFDPEDTTSVTAKTISTDNDGKIADDVMGGGAKITTGGGITGRGEGKDEIPRSNGSEASVVLRGRGRKVPPREMEPNGAPLELKHIDLTHVPAAS